MRVAIVLQIKAASKQAGVSTASMGKFDERLPGERPGERRIGQKVKVVGPVAAAPGQEGKKVRHCALAPRYAWTFPCELVQAAYLHTFVYREMSSNLGRQTTAACSRAEWACPNAGGHWCRLLAWWITSCGSGLMISLTWTRQSAVWRRSGITSCPALGAR